MFSLEDFVLTSAARHWLSLKDWRYKCQSKSREQDWYRGVFNPESGDYSMGAMENAEEGDQVVP